MVCSGIFGLVNDPWRNQVWLADICDDIDIDIPQVVRSPKPGLWVRLRADRARNKYRLNKNNK